MPVNLPNFLVIGAPKAGTTSLYNYLKQHPQVYMSPAKEPKFFAFEGSSLSFNGSDKASFQIRNSTIVDIESYEKLFSGVTGEIAIGEASPIYLHHSRAAERIHHYIPDCKFVAILRNPMERLYSDWKHNFHYGYETIGRFRPAVDAWQKKREKQNFIPYLNYVEKGYYAKHISRYLENFQHDRFALFLFEDLQAYPGHVMRSIFEFLGVDNEAVIDTNEKHMVAANTLWRFPRLQTRLSRINKTLQGSKLAGATQCESWIRKTFCVPPQLNDQDYRWLLRRYQNDIRGLEQMLSRDLSGWFDENRRKVEPCKRSMHPGILFKRQLVI